MFLHQSVIQFTGGGTHPTGMHSCFLDLFLLQWGHFTRFPTADRMTIITRKQFL